MSSNNSQETVSYIASDNSEGGDDGEVRRHDGSREEEEDEDGQLELEESEGAEEALNKPQQTSSSSTSANLSSLENDGTKIVPPKSRGVLQILVSQCIDVLKQNDGKGMDVQAFADLLDVEKRRIYDVTNVLEACNLLEKKEGNMYQWCGPFPVQEIKTGITPKEISRSATRPAKRGKLSPVVTLIASKRNAAEQVEELLDSKINTVKDSIASLSKVCYVRGSEVRDMLGNGQTLFAVEPSCPLTIKIPPPIFDALANSSLHQVCIMPTDHDKNNKPMPWVIIGGGGEVIRSVATPSPKSADLDIVSASALFVPQPPVKLVPARAQAREVGHDPLSTSPDIAMTQQTIGTFVLDSQSQPQTYPWKFTESLGNF